MVESRPAWCWSAGCSRRCSIAGERPRPRLEFPLYATAFSCLGDGDRLGERRPDSQTGRWGSGHPSIVPYSAFAVADGFVVIGAINDLMWGRTCDALALSELRDDARAASNEARVATATTSTARSPLRSRIARRRGRRELKRAGVLVAPVRGAASAVEDPQVVELALIDELDGVRLARTPLSQFGAGGSHPRSGWARTRRAVLDECLRLGADELEA